MFDPLLQLAPPWLMIVPLIGIINGCVFFLIVGRRPSSLPLYLAVAVLASVGMQSLALVQPGDPPLSLGEVNLVTTTVSAWASLVATRSVGL
jgi:hypothetical protein